MVNLCLLVEDGGYWGRYEASAHLMRGKFWVNNHAHVLKGKQQLLRNDFLLHLLIFADIARFISGTTRGKLTQSVMREILIPLPSLSEQQHIAAILQDVDQRIQAEENYKRAPEVLFKTLLKNLMTKKIQVKSLSLGERGLSLCQGKSFSW